jgi:hypothetical protein
MDKSFRTLKKRLLAPLIYTVAILLLFEEWLWDATKRLIALMPELRMLKALERLIERLPPYWALVVFALPAVLLLPVKLLALYSIAHGHATIGIMVIIVAKVTGTVLAARLYGLTKPALLSLAWFARWNDAFIGFKDRMIARLRATEAWQRITAFTAAINAQRRSLSKMLRNRYHTGRLGRLIRKFIAQQRARNR